MTIAEILERLIEDLKLLKKEQEYRLIDFERESVEGLIISGRIDGIGKSILKIADVYKNNIIEV